uniref:TFIIS-type domain-containing protein n=1 Tax=viral metagenome TaxID=1070528 RepID=A0A6C0JMY1_9ZZZZ
MASVHETKDYDDMSMRERGSLALATVLNQEQNIKIVEKYIHKKAKKKEDYDATYRKILFQTVGDILKGKDLKALVKDIKKEMVGWNHPTFADIKNRIDEHDEFIINPFEVEEGVTTCNCGSGRVFTYSKQCRGADEPMTTFAKCVKCKAQWTYSG